ncbi:MAG: hypothetical protein WA843_01395 [Candidatus Saccharimonadales bacterium]
MTDDEIRSEVKRVGHNLLEAMDDDLKIEVLLPAIAMILDSVMVAVCKNDQIKSMALKYSFIKMFVEFRKGDPINVQ